MKQVRPLDGGISQLIQVSRVTEYIYRPSLNYAQLERIWFKSLVCETLGTVNDYKNERRKTLCKLSHLIIPRPKNYSSTKNFNSIVASEKVEMMTDVVEKDIYRVFRKM